MSNKPLTNDAGEVRELDAEDIASMRPGAEVLPSALRERLPKRRPGQRGPGRTTARKLISLRIKPDVIEAYRATGSGWQSRMAEVLERNKPKA
jgi:uncharacterized protein (DUF4415 family)